MKHKIYLQFPVRCSYIGLPSRSGGLEILSIQDFQFQNFFSLYKDFMITHHILYILNFTFPFKEHYIFSHIRKKGWKDKIITSSYGL